MSESTRYQTSCLCNSVKISVANVNPSFSVCHCQGCRTWGGGPFFAVQCGTDVAFENADKINYYQSSDWAERGFCQDCGTHLFYRLKKTGAYNMPLGLFPDLENATMDIQYFSDKKPSYYCLANNTKEMTEAQIMAYFADQV
mgnify:FL=1